MPINITKIFDEDMGRAPNSELLENVKTITSSGGNVTKKMISDCKRTFVNAKFYSMHGLTEAFRSTYLDPNQIEIRPESIGCAIPDVELYVINEEGYECAPREVGELIHRGGYIYKGFWNAPEQNKERFKSIQILKDVINLEGQLTDEIVVATGDYVYKDEEGYFYFVSRHDDMIKTRGFRVSPLEIESVVKKNFPLIEQCVVFSIPNEDIEEEIVLVYSAKNEIASKELLFELKKHLASYMIPGKIIYKKSLPLVQSDKNRVNVEQLKKELINS
jgi:acyl-coenzyme A synthetase/AMP-(fatty) acid ligase